MVKSLAFLAAVAAADPRVVLHSREIAPPTWHIVSRADVRHKIEFTVALKQQQLDKLESKFWQIADPTHAEWRNFMTVEEINTLIAPKAEHMQHVQDWLSSNLPDATIDVAGDFIKVRSSAKHVEKLFDAEVHLFTHTNGHMVARTMGKVSVPDDVFACIDLVSGISEFPMPRSGGFKVPKPDANTVKAAVSPAVIPQSLMEMYSIPASHQSSITQSVAEFQSDSSYNKDDLKAFFTQLDITPETVADTVGPYSGQYPDMEATLDTQYMMGVGQTEVDWYWTSTGWMYDFSSNFFNSTKVPDSVSISWGWAEDGQCTSGIDSGVCTTLGIDASQYVARVNTEFMKIGARGVSLLAASGDSGANGRTDGECTGTELHASFPGSSPFITAVGATQFENAEYNLPSTPAACTALGSTFKCASGGTEVAVSSQVAGFTSGGGFSKYTPMPSYQKDAVETYLSTVAELPPSTYFNRTNRGYPDVAAMGNNYAVYVSSYGGWTTVGGTSASSPTFAAVMGYLNSESQKASGKPLGFLNPLLYKMQADSPGTFTDVIKGDNFCTEDGCFASCKGFNASKGWDPVTGLGTPVADKMLAYVQSMLASNTVQV